MHAPKVETRFHATLLECIFIQKRKKIKSLTVHIKNLSLKEVFKKFLNKRFFTFSLRITGKKLITSAKVFITSI